MKINQVTFVIQYCLVLLLIHNQRINAKVHLVNNDETNSTSGGDLGYTTKISRHASKRYQPTGRELWSLEEDDNQDITAARNETSKGEFSQTKEPEVFDVVIIGSGWAGITAAKTLMNKGVTNIKVLEARDEIGGRSRTVMKSIWQGEKDYPMDLGSQWIHGVDGNPITNVAITNDIPYMMTEELTRVYKENSGGAISLKKYAKFFQKFVFGSGGFNWYQDDLRSATKKDQSMKSVADKYIKQKDMSLNEEGIFDWFLDTTYPQDYARLYYL